MHSGCLSALRVRLESIKGGAVGRLIDTGVSIGGHSSTISYQESGQRRTATLTCACGWSVPLKSSVQWLVKNVGDLRSAIESHGGLPEIFRASQFVGD
jgi:hypothetical protein